MSLETLEKKLEFFLEYGIPLKKITSIVSLFSVSRHRIEENMEFLLDLGIPREKILKVPTLFYLSLKTLESKFDFLIEFGFDPNVIGRDPSIFTRNQETIIRNFRYLTDKLGIKQSTIFDLPNLLYCNPDTFAIKLRVLKVVMLGLKRGEFFDPDYHPSLYITSPSTIKAKKQYCLDNGIKQEKYLNLVKRNWHDFFKSFDPMVAKEDVPKLKEKLINPYKTRYDTWMKIYRKFAADFYERRGRRLIQKI